MIWGGGGYEDFVDIFGGHRMGIFLGVDKISNIFFGCLKFLIFLG